MIKKIRIGNKQKLFDLINMFVSLYLLLRFKSNLVRDKLVLVPKICNNYKVIIINYYKHSYCYSIFIQKFLFSIISDDIENNDGFDYIFNPNEYFEFDSKKNDRYLIREYFILNLKIVTHFCYQCLSHLRISNILLLFIL